METLDYFVMLFACLSILITVLSIIIHFSIPKLLVHPGELVLIQCFAQLFLDVHWLAATDELQA